MASDHQSGEIEQEMRGRLEARVEELKREMAVGEERLRTLDAEQVRVRETVLRLEGAVLAYGEVLNGETNNGASPAQPGEPVRGEATSAGS